MPLLTFFFLCVVWGTTWIAIKISLEGLPPFLGQSKIHTGAPAAGRLYFLEEDPNPDE